MDIENQDKAVGKLFSKDIFRILHQVLSNRHGL
jgi:hypothetical protein